MEQKRSGWLLVIAGAVVAGVILAVLAHLDVHLAVIALLEWIDTRPQLVQMLFILIMAAVVLLVLPGVFFTIGAGFVFGVIKGTIFVVLGTTLGAVLAFLVARYWFSERASRYLRNHPKLRRVNEYCASEGFKIVLAIRLLPFFPSKLANYFFGLTRFSLRDFTLGTAIGIIPYSLHNVYLGSLMANLGDLTNGTLQTPRQQSFYVLGFVLVVGVVWYLRRLAPRLLEAARTDEAEPPTNPDGGV